MTTVVLDIDVATYVKLARIASERKITLDELLDLFLSNGLS